VQRIVREPVASGVLFEMGTPTHLVGDIGVVERDRNGGVYAAQTVDSRVRYTVTSRPGRRDEAALAGDRALAPAPAGERYLALPPLDPAVGELARTVTADAASDAARALALERHLLRTGVYSDTPPRLAADDPRSPIERFLFEGRAGHCEYFASAFVVLARSAGLPARLVNGFAGGSENPFGGFVELSRSDAHAWAEVHYEKAGWVRYDPTPPDLRLRAAPGTSFTEQLGVLGSALEHWWFQHVVEFDRSDQAAALRRAWLAWRSWRGRDAARPAAHEAARPGLSEALGGALRSPRTIAVVAAGAVLLLVARGLRRRRVDRREIPECYAAALRLLARRGVVRGPADTAREFAGAAHRALPGAAADAFRSLTEAYLAERFGNHPGGSARAELQRLRHALPG
jgi:hypothetical protein